MVLWAKGKEGYVNIGSEIDAEKSLLSWLRFPILGYVNVRRIAETSIEPSECLGFAQLKSLGVMWGMKRVIMNSNMCKIST